MMKRKDRLLESTHSLIKTIPEIPAAHKSTMVASMVPLLKILDIFVAGRVRSATSLAGPNPKKRKLNEMADSEDYGQVKKLSQMQEDVKWYQQLLTEAEARNRQLLQVIKDGNLGVPQFKF